MSDIRNRYHLICDRCELDNGPVSAVKKTKLGYVPATCRCGHGLFRLESIATPTAGEEVKFKPGWLLQDVRRAAARLKPSTQENITMTEDQIKHMTNRFLQWKLPNDFNPDNGISAVRPNYAPNVAWEPVGTNLLTYTQAEAMVRFMIEHLPNPTTTDGDMWEAAHREGLEGAAQYIEDCGGYGFDNLAASIRALPVPSRQPLPPPSWATGRAVWRRHGREGGVMDWQPIETAPKDGTEIWAYLYQTGIHLMRWETSEQCAERVGDAPDNCDPSWVQVRDPDEDWSPEWWLPLDALPPAPSERDAKDGGER